MTSLAAKQLGIEPFVGTSPVELRPSWTEGDVQAVIHAAYRQVFGNDHLMQSERLTSAESLLRRGNACGPGSKPGRNGKALTLAAPVVMERPMFRTLRPLLFALDPETAHGVTIAALRHAPLPRAAADDPILRTRLAGLDLPNPIGLAAGFDKDVMVPDAMLRLGA